MRVNQDKNHDLKSQLTLDQHIQTCYKVVPIYKHKNHINKQINKLQHYIHSRDNKKNTNG